jgi:hypothetical protein
VAPGSDKLEYLLRVRRRTLRHSTQGRAEGALSRRRFMSDLKVRPPKGGAWRGSLLVGRRFCCTKPSPREGGVSYIKDQRRQSRVEVDGTRVAKYVCRARHAVPLRIGQPQRRF